LTTYSFEKNKISPSGLIFYRKTLLQIFAIIKILLIKEKSEKKFEKNTIAKFCIKNFLKILEKMREKICLF